MSEEKLEGILKPTAKSHGGVAVSHNKNTSKLEIVRMPAPEKVVLPMSMHIGAPCTPTVSVGDKVSVGTLIGDSDKFVSAPIHASVSGTVKAIGPVKTETGAMIEAVTIESDGEMRLADEIAPPKADTRDDFIKAIRASGLVGLGGAGFPTHVKLAFKPGTVDTLIINAAECEPFITVDNRECVDNSWDVLSGLYILKESLGFKNVIIAIEDNKSDIFPVLQKVAGDKFDFDDSVKLMKLKSRYPQGAEKVLIRTVTGRRVPPGKLPSDVGVVVMNVASVGFVGRFIKSGKPLVSRSLTVDGSAIAEPKNIRCPIGTSVADVIDFCGGFKTDPYKVMCGGPMMGIALADLNVPLVKNNNAILAFANDAARVKPEKACIRCGRCAQVCPMDLVPCNIEKLAHLKDTDALMKAGAMVCMECGSCAYACPSARPLVQYMRLSKQLIKEAGAK